MVEVPCPRSRRSYLRGLWPLGDQFTKRRTSCAFLAVLSVGWWARLMLLWDLSWGNWGRKFSVFKNLWWHWNKWVGKELLGWAEDHPQVSWMSSGARLLSHDLWSPDMQWWYLFIYQKTRVSDVAIAFPFGTAEESSGAQTAKNLEEFQECVN